MVTIESVRHAWQERAGFVIDRPNGHKHYTFLHFFGSVELLVGGELIKTSPHACILYDIGTPQYFFSKTTLTHDWMHLSGDLLPLLQSGGGPPPPDCTTLPGIILSRRSHRRSRRNTLQGVPAVRSC